MTNKKCMFHVSVVFIGILLAFIHSKTVCNWRLLVNEYTFVCKMCGWQATVCDISTEMLAVGKARPGVPPEPHLTWLEGDAENLPFEPEKFDIVTIGFGMRNVTHMDRAMEEAHRVLKAGGRFFCLEFSHVDNPVLSR